MGRQGEGRWSWRAKEVGNFVNIKTGLIIEQEVREGTENDHYGSVTSVAFGSKHQHSTAF